MNEMKLFENSEFGCLEVLWEEEKAYFPAIKCAEILGYSNPRDAIVRHCKVEGVVKHDVVSISQNQYGVQTEQVVTKKFISEGNLYRLIVRSKLEAAQRFERWVFDEVLPDIRRQGFHITTEALERLLSDPETAIRTFTALKEERDKNRALTEENRILTEKCSYLDLITACTDAVPITVIAKDYGMSGREMNRLLHGGQRPLVRCRLMHCVQAAAEVSLLPLVPYAHKATNRQRRLAAAYLLDAAWATVSVRISEGKRTYSAVRERG